LVNKLLAVDTGAKALARAETPTENVNANTMKPDFIIIVRSNYNTLIKLSQTKCAITANQIRWLDSFIKRKFDD
jgi:hypothetical protein